MGFSAKAQRFILYSALLCLYINSCFASIETVWTNSTFTHGVVSSLLCFVFSSFSFVLLSTFYLGCQGSWYVQNTTSRGSCGLVRPLNGLITRTVAVPSSMYSHSLVSWPCLLVDLSSFNGVYIDLRVLYSRLVECVWRYEALEWAVGTLMMQLQECLQ